jgi:hypothetical protein
MDADANEMRGGENTGLLVSEVYKKMPRFKKIFEVRNQQAALRALQAEHDA